MSSGRVRRGRLYYLRNLAGKAARLKEREQTVAAVETVPGEVVATPPAEA